MPSTQGSSRYIFPHIWAKLICSMNRSRGISSRVTTASGKKLELSSKAKGARVTLHKNTTSRAMVALPKFFRRHRFTLPNKICVSSIVILLYPSFRHFLQLTFPEPLLHRPCPYPCPLPAPAAPSPDWRAARQASLPPSPRSLRQKKPPPES